MTGKPIPAGTVIWNDSEPGTLLPSSGFVHLGPMFPDASKPPSTAPQAPSAQPPQNPA
jgi:hypothetical protein